MRKTQLLSGLQSIVSQADADFTQLQANFVERSDSEVTAGQQFVRCAGHKLPDGLNIQTTHALPGTHGQIQIHNQLVQSGKPVRVEILGMAASAASVIAMAGDEIAIAENAFLMIHNAWGIVAGNKVDMRSFAAVLDQIDAALVATYARRTGGDAGEIAAMMDAETWLAGPEAIERGFAGELLDSDGEALAFDLSVYHNAPSVLPSGHTEPTRRDAERALRDAGFSRAKAKAIAAIVDSDGLRDAGSANVSEIVARLDAIAAGLKSRT